MTNPENLMALYSELLLQAPDTTNDQLTLNSAKESRQSLLNSSVSLLKPAESEAMYWLNAIIELSNSRLSG